MPLIHGSCLCGDLAWEAHGDFELMSHCHCSRCRKAHGAGFATYVGTNAESFRWTKGRDRARAYESSPGLHRRFCPRCGSVLPGEPNNGRVFLPAGNLDEDPGVRPLAHLFAASKAPWLEIADELPRFDAWPPDFDGPALPPLDRERQPGHVRGSCLCGEVRFEFEGTPLRVRHCHCGRCRKARSAAHATNVFVEPERFRWLAGEDAIDFFHVPGAERFRNVFCRTCGGLTPRMGLRYVVIPAGSLDDEPGGPIDSHIFVAWKAPGFEIGDDLPQHDEYPPEP